MNESITLVQLNERIGRLITSNSGTQNVWVTAELSDVAVRGGHCYMELLEKDDAGRQIAKARGIIWANVYRVLNSKFAQLTGSQFTSGLKLLLKASATMHPVFGLSLVITDLDPDYTMGDLLRRRRENIERLTRDGVINMNKELPWPANPQNIAVISARGAAGYGDFINQLMHNPHNLRFTPRLFEAVMQGEKAPASIIAALDAINNEHCWDCVVIIRGGGSTSDLQCFEDYELALNIAQFDIPVIIGIGHERDITLLDWVANMRVKTPTAAAEWLISLGDKQLAQLDSIAHNIYVTVTDIITAQKEQLSYYQGLLPVIPFDATRRATMRLNRAMVMLSSVSSSHIAPWRSRLDVIATTIVSTSQNAVTRNHERLAAAEQLLNALSPQAVLNRGYSITRAGDKIITSAQQVAPGTTLETTTANGTITSTAQ